MHVIHATCVDDAPQKGLRYLGSYIPGDVQRRQSRNGAVVVSEVPVTTVYPWPLKRVSFWPERDANPFFHLYESLWMLGGRNDVAPVASYVKRMETFSDDGHRLHGAYGHRWRKHFGFDQLPKIARRLREDQDDRRCVLQMWDAGEDLDMPRKDLPCNTQVYFTRSHLGNLDMTVCCRSNDIIWGAYGANAVHFSILQEYMAASIGCPVGVYYQISNNYHAYTPLFDELLKHAVREGPLTSYPQTTFPLVATDVNHWDVELAAFLEQKPFTFQDPFFVGVAQPMHDAYRFHKDGRTDRALQRMEAVLADDWRSAGINWLERRLVRSATPQRATHPSEEA